MKALLALGFVAALASPALGAEQTLSWNPAPGATAYRLYYCVQGNSCWRYEDLRNWRLYVEKAEPKVTVRYRRPTWWMAANVFPGAELRRFGVYWYTRD